MRGKAQRRTRPAFWQTGHPAAALSDLFTRAAKNCFIFIVQNVTGSGRRSSSLTTLSYGGGVNEASSRASQHKQGATRRYAPRRRWQFEGGKTHGGPTSVRGRYERLSVRELNTAYFIGQIF